MQGTEKYKMSTLHERKIGRGICKSKGSPKIIKDGE